MLRKLIDSITKFICFTKRKLIVTPKEKPVKVNLGSGLSVEKGWINIDSSLNAFFAKWPHFILKWLYKMSGSNEWYSQKEYCDILKNNTFIHYNTAFGLPFSGNSVDYIYSSHLLEHMFKQDVQKLFKDAARVLKKGGVMRIGVPDLERAVLLYQNGNKEPMRSYFTLMSESAYFSILKCMYDFELLHQLFEEAGFTKIERCSYRQGKTPDIELLDNRPEETLFVEATK